MEFQKLDIDTVEIYLSYLKKAFAEEPREMTAESIDEDGIRRRVEDPFYQNTISILAVEEETVLGRIEFHFYGCVQNGYRMAYVDWVYVLPEYRHQGVAQGLFREFEKECVSRGINQYYLIRSEKENADRFYKAFPDAALSREPMLRKDLNQDGKNI